MTNRPSYMDSPLARLFASVVASDETARAIEFAQLSAKAEAAQMYRDAEAYAVQCIESCGAESVKFDAETLSHNIESNFPDLTVDECDEIASAAIEGWGPR